MTLGVIRVVTLDDSADIDEHGRLMEKFSGVHTVSMSIADQPNGVHDSDLEREAVPKIIAMGEQLASRADVDAVTVSCASDPAVVQLRQRLDMMVIGAGRSGASIALAAGSRVGVIGITEVVPTGIETVLGDALFDYRHSDKAQMTTSLGNVGVFEALAEHAGDLETKGADALLFACTGFSSIGLKEHLRSRVSVPIIDLIEAQATSYALLKGTP